MNSPAKPRHVVVLCHPQPDSFNAAIAAHYCEVAAQCGHEAVLRDLYRMKFDPVLRADEQLNEVPAHPSTHVAHERALVADARVLVLVYPIWLGSPPAMMKGYVERVFGADFALRAAPDHAAGSRLAGKHLLSFTTSGNSQIWLEEQGEWQSLLHLFDRYLEHAFAMASANHVHFPSIVKGLSERFVEQNMEEVARAAREACRTAEKIRIAG